MAKLSSAEVLKSRGFLADILCMGGLLPEAKHPARNICQYRGSRSHHPYSMFVDEATIICKEIRNRLFEFSKVDRALRTLESFKFYADPKTDQYSKNTRTTRKTADKLAAYLANFCKENAIYWDDIHTNKTTYELESYKDPEQTLFGAALWEYECFLSQNLGASNTTSQKATSTTKATNKSTGGQPKDTYKTDGPMSGKVRALVGQPNVKMKANGSDIFFIRGEKVKDPNNPNKKTKPQYAFIRPLNPVGNKNGVNKIFIGDPSGYRDFKIYFDELSDANQMLLNIQNNNIIPASIENVKVYKEKVDSNGYFVLKTEFGDAAVKASDLNESLREEATQEEKVEYIKNIDAYHEAFIKYE